MRASARSRWRGRRTPSVGSVAISRSRTAARNTERTLTNRVLTVPGASGPRVCVVTVIDFTQVSTWVVRILRSSIDRNDVPRTASDIATCVLEVHTCRAAQDSKNSSNVTLPADDSTHRPESIFSSS